MGPDGSARDLRCFCLRSRWFRGFHDTVFGTIPPSRVESAARSRQRGVNSLFSQRCMTWQLVLNCPLSASRRLDMEI